VAGRLGVGYLVVFGIGAALAATSFTLGAGRKPQPRVAGVYRATAPCLGAERELTLKQSGQFVDASGGLSGSLRFRHGRLTGRVHCAGGSHARLDLTRRGTRERTDVLEGTLDGRPFDAVFVRDVPKPGVPSPSTSSHTNEQTFGRLTLAIALVILAARLVRALIGRIGQPPVMGEVLAGILLGPTLLGAVWPSLQHYLFPSFVVPLLTGAADIGLAFYMFLVGLELDPRQLRGRLSHAAAISNASVVLPLGLGIALALPLYGLLGTPDKSFQAFALFMGVAMSITAFPVLARILIERRMLGRPLGALALSAAAVDDVTAWGLLAIASGVAGHGSAFHALPVLGYVFAFCAAMALLARPLLARVSAAYDEAGHVPAAWIAAIFVGVLLSAYASMKAGIAPIFGAFVMGLVMPRRADLSHDVTRRVEDFVATVLLPLFFVVTGLKTDVGLLDRPVLWALTAAIVAVAIVGKWLGALGIARLAGYGLRESAIVGALMNTRGLTELIVLNIGLELGVISQALFTMLVLMALATTFMTAPVLHALDPRRRFSAPVEDELAEPPGARSILVAPLGAGNVDALVAIAEPLARGEPEREIVLARPLPPPRVGATLAARERELDQANRELARLGVHLKHHGVAMRPLAFTSTNRADDLVRLARSDGIDLLLVDGRRPLVGTGPAAGEVGALLARAPCDVAVLVSRERLPAIDPEHPIAVQGSAALDLAAALARETDAPLRVAGTNEDLAEAARGAGLVVVELPRGTRASAARLPVDQPVLYVRPRETA